MTDAIFRDFHQSTMHWHWRLNGETIRLFNLIFQTIGLDAIEIQYFLFYPQRDVWSETHMDSSRTHTIKDMHQFQRNLFIEWKWLDEDGVAQCHQNNHALLDVQVRHEA